MALTDIAGLRAKGDGIDLYSIWSEEADGPAGFDYLSKNTRELTAPVKNCSA